MQWSAEGEDYLRQYPEFRKWVNQCAGCQATGLKPEMPKDVGTSLYSHQEQEAYYGAGAGSLRRMFKPLPLNERGLCAQCAALAP